MTPKVKYKIIPYVIYPFNVIVSFQKFSELEKTLKEILHEDVWDEIKIFDNDFSARTVMFSSGQTCICFRKFYHGIVAHEVFHAVDFLMDKIGMSLVPESNEAYAYLIEYLTNEIYKL